MVAATGDDVWARAITSRGDTGPMKELTIRRVERALARRVERNVVTPLELHVQRPLERGLLRRRPRAHLIHVGKTGGTAMKDVFRTTKVPARYEIILHGHRDRLSQVPAGEKVFFVVRDPVDRFVSGFNSRLRRGQPRYLVEWTPAERLAFEEFTSADSLGRALSSDDPEQRARAAAAMISIRHVRDSYWNWFGSREYLDSRRDDLLLVQWFPDLTTTFPQLCRLLGLPEDSVLPTDGVRAHRSPSDVDRSLSEVARANIERWYGADYAFVEYCASLDCFAAPSRVRVKVKRPEPAVGSLASGMIPAVGAIPPV